MSTAMSTQPESPLTYEENLDVENIRRAAAALEKAYVDMHRRLDDVSGKVMQFEPYPLEGACGRLTLNDYDGNSPARQRALLKQAYDASLPIRERNAAAAKNNLQIRTRFEALFANAGIPQTVRRHKAGSRSRFKFETVDSDWVLGFKMAIPVTDPWSHWEQQYESCMRRLDDWEKRLKNEREAAELAKSAAERKVRDAATLMVLSEKYGCAGDVWSVGDALFAKSKYLRLAHFLRKNRSDWAEGPYFARTGLEGFTIETDQDREIHDDLWPHIHDWDGDGRVFRDCKWSFDRLFAMVDPALLADYEKWAGLYEVQS